jgi:protein-tyrosine phosphatase
MPVLHPSSDTSADGSSPIACDFQNTLPLDGHFEPDPNRLVTWIPENQQLVAIAMENREPFGVLYFTHRGRMYSTATRVIQLEGALNFRDAGGYATPHGSTSWRKWFRSDNLANLTTKDWQTIEQLGIKYIYDLRTEDEDEISPTKAPRSITVTRFPMSGKLSHHEDITRAILTGQIKRVSVADMVELYQDIVSKHLPDIEKLTKELMELDAGSLVHCTAGKDRTGLVIAHLQLTQQVALEKIREDYFLSSLYRGQRRFLELRNQIAASGTVPLAVRSYLIPQQKALDVLFERLGRLKLPD